MRTRIMLLILFVFGVIFQSNANILTVTNTKDSGAGTLRQAIADAGFSEEPDTILFQIPQTDAGYQAAEGIWVIQPLTYLNYMNNDSMFVDGTSQSIFIGSDTNPLGPEIVIDGSLCSWFNGLLVEADYIRIHYLIINKFRDTNIVVSGNHCQITGCYVGTDHTGSQRVSPGSYVGIRISYANDNVIGGESETDRNIISGNNEAGINLSRARRNKILNNFIGLNAEGSDTLGNQLGINLSDGQHNTIGPNNVISGNTFHGINFLSDDSDSNTVAGNFIGTDISGSFAIQNHGNGINIMMGDHNIIGGETEETRNIISGNEDDGIYFYQADSNYVFGNYIGTDQSGLIAIPNGNNGARISGRHNLIGLVEAGAGNLISGNTHTGINLFGNDSERNICAGNLIGTDIAGENELPNGSRAIQISGGAHDNKIGPRNTIAFSPFEGVSIIGTTSLRNTITRNSFHSNTGRPILLRDANFMLEPPVFTTIAPLGGTANPNVTVEIFSTPDAEALIYEATVIADGTGHFYWPGTPAGPYVTATATDPDGNTSELSSPRLAGHLTVTNTGDTGMGSLHWAIDMANANTGPDTITFNISDTDIGFNGTVWIIQSTTALPELIDSATVIDGTTQTLNQGNRNPDGPEIMLNGRADPDVNGISIISSYNVIRGLIISGFDNGIYISNRTGHHNRIVGNYIGTTANGQETLPNNYGITLTYNGGWNIIGGPSPEETNLISGNLANGLYIVNTEENTITGNLVGTTIDGINPLPNGQNGIFLISSRKNNIGGPLEGESNVISGNGFSGIVFYSSESQQNTVQGNLIGTDIFGEKLLPNGWSAIRILNGANRNSIGGVISGVGNVICGRDHGIEISGEGSDLNIISNNFIGTDRTGTLPLGNDKNGVNILTGAHNNRVGPNNIIRSNLAAGVEILNENSHYNTITQNAIYNNEGGGILLQDQGNDMLRAPEITGLEPVTGTAVPNAIVEFFSDSTNQGRIYEGSTVADASGNFTFSGTITGPRVTATATDAHGNTSQFSQPVLISGLFVTHTGDDGDNSLRWAIEFANNRAGADTILFNIPATDPNFDGTAWWIYPQSQLPALEDSGTVIQGFSQTELHGETNPDGPEIVLCGEQITEMSSGIWIRSNACEINGFIINCFSYYGIFIRDVKNTVIRGNYIGTTPAGTDTLPNGTGIYSQGRKSRIGGTDRHDRNIVSGNKWDGILIEFGAENQILGNYIGISRTGTAALANGRTGIRLGSGSQDNIIGGNIPEARNIISGNISSGVTVANEDTRCNQILGNYIGTDTSGTIAISNGREGIEINGAHNNHVGGATHEQGNLVSGNGSNGVRIFGTAADSNLIQNNFIGADVQGASELGNKGSGISISNGASQNNILDNIVSGNGDTGISILITETDSNRVENNIIGLDVTGQIAMPNYIGIRISQQAQHNIINDNIISGNMNEGIVITDDGTFYNRISANWIGLNATGHDTLPNGRTGIIVGYGADYTIIGGISSDRNIISANRSSGIYITADTTREVSISYNWIGTDITGARKFGNRFNGISLNGMDHQIEYNLISGNLNSGILLREPS